MQNEFKINKVEKTTKVNLTKKTVISSIFKLEKSKNVERFLLTSILLPVTICVIYIQIFNSFYFHNLAIREKYYPHKQYCFQYDKA